MESRFYTLGRSYMCSYALDRFDRFLGVLVKTENMSNEIDTLHQGIAVLFPDMRDARSDYLIGRAFF
jgi:hypothetical protein